MAPCQPSPLPATDKPLKTETFVEPEAAVSVYMLFIEECFAKKKKKFFLGKNKEL